MNKLLLLSLIILLGVLAYVMGLFSNEKSTTLSQYVPDSVGQLFSNDTPNSPTQQSKSQNLSSIPTLVMPDYSKSSDVVVDDKSLMTTNTKEVAFTSEGFGGISDNLIQEIQQEFTPNPNKETFKAIKSSLSKVEAENQSLKSKLDALSADLNNRSAVLKQIEKQIEKLNN